MEKDGEHYVYGELPFIPDAFDTMLTRELVEANLGRLKNFPTARYMHKEPIGIIDFEHSINGYRTFIDDNAFHCLIKIFDVCEKEFKMISQGQYGLSYGLMPKRTEKRRVNGKDVTAFVEGSFYEVSIVDSPAIEHTEVTILRSLIQETAKPREEGFIAMLEASHPAHPKTPQREQPPNSEFRRMLEASGKNVQRQMSPTNIIPIDFEYQLPEICDENCPIYRHCSSYPANIGNPCLKRWEKYKNRSES